MDQVHTGWRTAPTEHTDESQAHIFAATTVRMVGLTQSESSLDEKQRLLEIAHDPIKGICELEGSGPDAHYLLGQGRRVSTARQEG